MAAADIMAPAASTVEELPMGVADSTGAGAATGVAAAIGKRELIPKSPRTYRENMRTIVGETPGSKAAGRFVFRQQARP
jgi:hypothetical protein